MLRRFYSIKIDEAPPVHPNSNNKTQFRLNKINEILDYFIAEIREKETISKRLSKYITAFDNFDKNLIVLSALKDGVSIISFSSITGIFVGIASASFSFVFSLKTGIVKRLLKAKRNKKKEHNKTVMIARWKLNSIEASISPVLINSEISYKDFATIINQKENYRRLKGFIRLIKFQRSDDEKDKLIEEGKRIGINKIVRQNNGNTCKLKTYFLFFNKYRNH